MSRDEKDQEHSFYEGDKRFLFQKIKREMEVNARVVNIQLPNSSFFSRDINVIAEYIFEHFLFRHFVSLFLFITLVVVNICETRFWQENSRTKCSCSLLSHAATLNRAPQFSTCVPWCTCARVCASLCAVLAATWTRVCIAPCTE